MANDDGKMQLIVRYLNGDDFPKVKCGCGGWSRRMITAVDNSSIGIHGTDISTEEEETKFHYHNKLEEIYYILAAEEGQSCLQVGEEKIPVVPDMIVRIPPGREFRHRGVGKPFLALVIYFPAKDHEKDMHVIEDE